MPTEWRQNIGVGTGFCHTSASDDHFTECGTVLLPFHVLDLQVHVWFGAVENLVAMSFIGTPYIVRFKSCILILKQIAVPVHPGAVTIIMVYTPDFKKVTTIDITKTSMHLSDSYVTQFWATKLVIFTSPDTIKVVPIRTWQADLPYFLLRSRHVQIKHWRASKNATSATLTKSVGVTPTFHPAKAYSIFVPMKIFHQLLVSCTSCARRY